MGLSESGINNRVLLAILEVLFVFEVEKVAKRCLLILWLLNDLLDFYLLLISNIFAFSFGAKSLISRLSSVFVLEIGTELVHGALPADRSFSASCTSFARFYVSFILHFLGLRSYDNLRTLRCPPELDIIFDADWQETLVETRANRLLVGKFTAQNFERWWNIHFFDHSLPVLFLLLVKHLLGDGVPALSWLFFFLLNGDVEAISFGVLVHFPHFLLFILLELGLNSFIIFF